jgi:hypothetical protein
MTLKAKCLRHTFVLTVVELSSGQSIYAVTAVLVRKPSPLRALSLWKLTAP